MADNPNDNLEPQEWRPEEQNRPQNPDEENPAETNPAVEPQAEEIPAEEAPASDIPVEHMPLEGETLYAAHPPQPEDEQKGPGLAGGEAPDPGEAGTNLPGEGAPEPVVPPATEPKVEMKEGYIPTTPEPVPSRYVAPAPLSPADERTWAMLAHLSVLLNLVTGFLGPLAAFLIYLVFKDRSRYVAYHSLQATIFQLIWWVGAGALIGIIWAVTGILSAVIIGLLFIPLALVLTVVLLAAPVVALIYGVLGGIETSQGHDFRYWLVGDWVRNTLFGK